MAYNALNLSTTSPPYFVAYKGSKGSLCRRREIDQWRQTKENFEAS